VRDGGIVQSATSLDQHVQQLASVLEDEGAVAERNREFVRWFVRPHGLDRPAVPIFTAAVEAIRQLPPPAPKPDAGWLRAARVPGRVLAHAALSLADGRPAWVYAVRQPMTLAIQTAALWYRLSDRWQDHGRPLMKRARRASRRSWHRSSLWLGHRWHRSKKMLRRLSHEARGTARRFARLR
jgi:hypothetical protein